MSGKVETTKLEPTENRVLIRQDAAEKEKKKGSIILTGQDKQPNFGTVIAVGPGKKLDNGTRVPMTIQPGWRVAYPPYAVTTIELNDEVFLVIDEPAILAVFVTV